MNKEKIQIEIRELIKEFGKYPFQFFTILSDSENPNVDFAVQNKLWAFLKNEEWHSLAMSNYYLWAISDNGDLLWWNGVQTIAMAPRDNEFFSTPVSPTQFIKLVGLKKVGSIFPDDLK